MKALYEARVKPEMSSNFQMTFSQMDLPSQSSTDALHTTTPTARSSTMHIYRRQMNPQSIKHRCLAYCYTHC